MTGPIANHAERTARAKWSRSITRSPHHFADHRHLFGRLPVPNHVYEGTKAIAPSLGTGAGTERIDRHHHADDCRLAFKKAAEEAEAWQERA